MWHQTALLGRVAFLFLGMPLLAQEQARVESFSPHGTVKKIRQARARFSEPMVALGDLRLQAPFTTACTEKGAGRWVDSRNWVYDFERDLPAGIHCTFRLRADVRTLAGRALGGTQEFLFSTGGPAITMSRPPEGSYVEEEQIFLLELDGEPTESSVLANTYFAVEKIPERIGVRVVSGELREAILKTRGYYGEGPAPYRLLIQATRRFPSDARLSLVWGRGIAAKTGVATEADQVLPFLVRAPFTATFHCQHENPQADCVPISPVRLSFSAWVAREQLNGSTLTGTDGRRWTPQAAREGYEDERFVNELVFSGPFPEKASFTLVIPAGIKDDADRPLSNAANFPLTIRTDEYPPLAKFAADFGILELKGDAALPVTLRNVEPAIAGRTLKVVGGQGTMDPPTPSDAEQMSRILTGRALRVPDDQPSQMLSWIEKLRRRTWDDRGKSLFGEVTAPLTTSFKLPKPAGGKAFEVVGIPMKAPGFYVVEIESELLGAALLGRPGRMYVPTTVLVTNLAVHLKRGIESSLVWVTTLDKARPVPGAAVQVIDCSGAVLWEGKTDGSGVARPAIPTRQQRFRPDQPQPCLALGTEPGSVLVTARIAGDMAFVHSSWQEGIESWRFRLPMQWDRRLSSAHTVFDRTLFRTGETVHMKHLLRRRGTSGMSLIRPEEMPARAVVQHLGSEQRYELPLEWDRAGTAETTWVIPKDAKLGQYGVSLINAEKDEAFGGLQSGAFRVEDYRVPLMRGIIRPPVGPLVQPSSIPVDLTATYLAGGPAGTMPVRFRYDLQPGAPIQFDNFEEFIFSNGKVKEGLVRGGEEEEESGEQKPELHSTDLTLDRNGSARTVISGLPRIEMPHQLLAEFEFRDPNGQVQTVASRMTLLAADRHIGIRTDSWVLNRDLIKFQVAVTDLAGKAVANSPVKVDVFQQRTYSHRKRLVGGFYAYEHLTETKRLATLCEGSTDAKGLLACSKPSPATGNMILQATTRDTAGREEAAQTGLWVAGKDQWWFRAEDDDRMDVVPEARRYEPGDKARLQVRMPFRKATALVTVEREGVADAFVRELSGNEPVIEIPVKPGFAPNTFVSVLAVRGRVAGVRPTATVDLARPAYKLGIAQIKVGWRAHELKVNVSAERPVYKVREKARISISVTTADTKLPARGGEAAIAAVDEGLLELMPNESWKLLDAMMGQRGYAVQTSTAQMHVIGKRHFGLKAMPQGGGGGRQSTRELFETLLLWQGRVPLDNNGQATVEVPLNDSITSFRIVAIATAGIDRFGTGSTSIRSTQDLMIFSGIAPVARSGDRIRSEFTVRNATERGMAVQVSARWTGGQPQPAAESFSLAAGESRVLGWNVSVPEGVDSLRYEVQATGDQGAGDRLSVTQKVVPLVPVRTVQATLAQVTNEIRAEVDKPGDAAQGRGGIDVSFRPTLVEGMGGITEYMQYYPYTCLEQLVSRAVALRDSALWKRIAERLPSFVDSDGLLKYFPGMRQGSDSLTAYVAAIANEAGMQIPEGVQERMAEGLRGFVEGRVIRYSSLPTADLSIRKITALEALSRIATVDPALLSSITIEPNLWPTSAVIDWANILGRVPVRMRDERVREADQILRSRLNLQGTTMGFSTERSDYLWWLMVSTDTNALRFILSRLESPAWKEDMPRLVRGVLGRQQHGHWDTTVANAWGVLAIGKFSAAFEKTPVTGSSKATLAGNAQSVDWGTDRAGRLLHFGWPAGRGILQLSTSGTGAPWATIQSLAAVPLREPLSSGFKIKKTITPLEPKQPGAFTAGDILRVRLELEAQSDMTWVVVEDPIPAGAAILGTGLGRDSGLATGGERQTGWVWPEFEERSFEAFRSYYSYVPKGAWSLEYTYRMNSSGTVNLPPTRVEALYSPEMFGEIPNGQIQIR